MAVKLADTRRSLPTHAGVSPGRLARDGRRSAPSLASCRARMLRAVSTEDQRTKSAADASLKPTVISCAEALAPLATAAASGLVDDESHRHGRPGPRDALQEETQVGHDYGGRAAQRVPARIEHGRVLRRSQSRAVRHSRARRTVYMYSRGDEGCWDTRLTSPPTSR